ncbi:MAG: hypothetical protein ACLVFL_05205 [Eubacterium sp.]
MLTLACCKGGWKNGVKIGIRYWIGKDYEIQISVKRMLWRFTKIIVENADMIEQIKKIVVENKKE